MICRIHDEEILPADMIALKTAKPEGVLYLETSGLDGEKALKNRYVCRQHQ
jgi:magnesium-transporting ATPase (P-type)